MHDDGLRPIAKGHLNDSGDLILCVLMIVLRSSFLYCKETVPTDRPKLPLLSFLSKIAPMNIVIRATNKMKQIILS